MENLTKDSCDCNDCRFVKDTLLMKLMHDYYLPIDPSFIIHKIYTTHTQSNAIFPPNSVVYVSMYLHRQTSINMYRCTILSFIIKIPNQNQDTEEQVLFNNEMQFYKNIQNCVLHVLSSKCYFANIFSSESLQRPIIVLKDLTANGYTKQVDKLDEERFLKYMITLGFLHAETFRMQLEAPHIFQYMLQHMRFESKDQIKDKEEQAFCDFLNRLDMANLPINIRIQLIRKSIEVKHLQKCVLTTIIHGCFTRDAIAVKMDDMRIIDFRKIRRAPPVIDFGRLLLTNLPNERKDLQTFCLNAMDMYLISLQERYPKMNIKLLKQEIYDNLLYSYINLTSDERLEIPQPEWILEVLNQFCKY